MTNRIRVWDSPTRLAHWLLVALVALSWWTAETHRMEWHRYSGYVLLGVLVFRLYWGVVGSSTARFARFVRSPAAVWSYLRGANQASVGHNPLGGWSVLALLSLLIAQVVLGLFAVDIDGIESGPLSHLVSFDTGRTMAEWHEDLFNVLMAFIILHLAAIAFYAVVKRNNLLGPMVTGWKKSMSLQAAEFAPWWRALVGIAIAASVVWSIV